MVSLMSSVDSESMNDWCVWTKGARTPCKWGRQWFWLGHTSGAFSPTHCDSILLHLQPLVDIQIHPFNWSFFFFFSRNTMSLTLFHPHGWNAMNFFSVFGYCIYPRITWQPEQLIEGRIHQETSASHEDSGSPVFQDCAVVLFSKQFRDSK